MRYLYTYILIYAYTEVVSGEIKYIKLYFLYLVTYMCMLMLNYKFFNANISNNLCIFSRQEILLLLYKRVTITFATTQ